MTTKELTITNDIGLHARCASSFIQCANKFKSSLWVQRGERRINAKSLLGVLSLGIIPGTSFEIIADGIDEDKAINALESLILSNFAENV